MKPRRALLVRRQTSRCEGGEGGEPRTGGQGEGGGREEWGPTPAPSVGSRGSGREEQALGREGGQGGRVPVMAELAVCEGGRKGVRERSGKS